MPKAVLLAILRPDIIMWSAEEKRIILVELSVLWDEGCEEAAGREKREIPAQDCRDKGETTWLLASDDKGRTEGSGL